jgi:hypothetical protein
LYYLSDLVKRKAEAALTLRRKTAKKEAATCHRKTTRTKTKTIHSRLKYFDFDFDSFLLLNQDQVDQGISCSWVEIATVSL